MGGLYRLVGRVGLSAFPEATQGLKTPRQETQIIRGAAELRAGPLLVLGDYLAVAVADLAI